MTKLFPIATLVVILFIMNYISIILSGGQIEQNKLASSIVVLPLMAYFSTEYWAFKYMTAFKILVAVVFIIAVYFYFKTF